MNTAASGEPRIIVTSAPPTRCPLVPIETGRLKDWSAKIPAARTATHGNFSSFSSFFAHRRERYIKTRAIIQ